MSGYGTVQEMQVYERFVGRVDPTLVFLQFYVNDLSDNLDSNPATRRPIAEIRNGNQIRYVNDLADESVWRKELKEFKASGYLPSDRSGFFGRSHLIAKSRVAWRKAKNWYQAHPLRFQSRPDPVGVFRWIYTPVALPLAGEYGVFEQILDDFKTSVEADGAEIALIYIPDEPEINDSKLLEEATARELELSEIDAQLLFGRIKAIADGLGIPVINTSKMLIEALNNGEKVYWERDKHLTEAGHRAVADSVLEWVGSRR